MYRIKRKNKTERILENIFDVITGTTFYDEAKKELNQDLGNHNISWNPAKLEIDIENANGTKILYKINIVKI